MKASAEINRDLPYFSLFDIFRRNGYSIGIAEYSALLELLTGAGLYEPQAGLISEQELLSFCKLLWLKPGQVPYIFESLFREQYRGLFATATPAISASDQSQPEAPEPDGADENEPAEQLEMPPAITADESPVEKPGDGSHAAEPAKPQTEYFRIVIGGESGEQTLFKHDKLAETDRRFLFTDYHHPVSGREIYQLFSKAAEKKPKRASDQIDIPATIKMIAENGYLKEIAFQQEQEINNHLLFLHDQKGSMVAFEQLSGQLSHVVAGLFRDIAHAEGHVRDYYFQNVVGDFIYLNPESTRFLQFSELIRNFKNKKAALVIISDGGAARGSNSDKRVKQTIRMLMKLQPISSRIVWLNPLPRLRWVGTSAERIGKFVPMFEIDHQGLSHAVAFIRGKQFSSVS